MVLVVCLVLATLLALTPRREGSLRQTRLSPIAQTLRELALDGEMPAGENENGSDDAVKHPEAVGAEQPDIS